MLFNINTKVCKTNINPGPSNQGAESTHTTQHISYIYCNYTYIQRLGVYQMWVSTMPSLQAHIIQKNRIVVQTKSTSHI